jgi:hypothetical protein
VKQTQFSVNKMSNRRGGRKVDQAKGEGDESEPSSSPLSPRCTDGEEEADRIEAKYGNFRMLYGGSQLYKKYNDGYSSGEDDASEPPAFLRNIPIDRDGENKYDLEWPSAEPEENEIFLSQSSMGWKLASKN